MSPIQTTVAAATVFPRGHMAQEELKVIAIRNYMEFLSLFSTTYSIVEGHIPAHVQLPEGAIIQPLSRNCRHPWVGAWNVREANDLALETLGANGIQFDTFNADEYIRNNIRREK
jgi:hypothetical protein